MQVPQRQQHLRHQLAEIELWRPLRLAALTETLIFGRAGPRMRTGSGMRSGILHAHQPVAAFVLPPAGARLDSRNQSSQLQQVHTIMQANKACDFAAYLLIEARLPTRRTRGMPMRPSMPRRNNNKPTMAHLLLCHACSLAGLRACIGVLAVSTQEHAIEGLKALAHTQAVMAFTQPWACKPANRSTFTQRRLALMRTFGTLFCFDQCLRHRGRPLVEPQLMNGTHHVVSQHRRLLVLHGDVVRLRGHHLDELCGTSSGLERGQLRRDIGQIHCCWSRICLPSCTQRRCSRLTSAPQALAATPPRARSVRIAPEQQSTRQVSVSPDMRTSSGGMCSFASFDIVAANEAHSCRRPWRSCFGCARCGMCAANHQKHALPV